MNTETIKTIFARYSGEDLTGETDRAALCLSLCEDCAAMAERMALAPDAAETGLLESWAAAEAFYQLTLRDQAVAPELLTADGVRVDARERAGHAKALAEEKRRAVRPLLREEGFWFANI